MQQGPVERPIPPTNTPVRTIDTVQAASGESWHYEIGFLHKACPNTAACKRVGSSVQQGMPARWKRKAGTDAAISHPAAAGHCSLATR